MPPRRAANGRTPRLDSSDRRRISRRHRRLESAAGVADLAHLSVRISRATHGSRLLRAHVAHAIGALRHVHRPEFCSLVFVLRDEPHPGVPAHQNLGRRKSRSRRDEVFRLHISRQRRDAALVPRNLFRERHIRLCSTCQSCPERFAHRQHRVVRLCRNLSRPRGQSAALSHFTPGCPTRTKPRPSASRWC